MRLHASDLGGDDLRKQYYDQTNIPEYTTLLGRPLLFPSWEEGDRYLNIYFSTTHLAYPFLSRPLIYASTIDSSLIRWRANLPRHFRFDLGHIFEKSVAFQRQV
jgi:hypothetical protein